MNYQNIVSNDKFINSFSQVVYQFFYKILQKQKKNEHTIKNFQQDLIDLFKSDYEKKINNYLDKQPYDYKTSYFSYCDIDSWEVNESQSIKLLDYQQLVKNICKLVGRYVWVKDVGLKMLKQEQQVQKKIYQMVQDKCIENLRYARSSADVLNYHDLEKQIQQKGGGVDTYQIKNQLKSEQRGQRSKYNTTFATPESQSEQEESDQESEQEESDQESEQEESDQESEQEESDQESEQEESDQESDQEKDQERNQQNDQKSIKESDQESDKEMDQKNNQESNKKKDQENVVEGQMTQIKRQDQEENVGGHTRRSRDASPQGAQQSSIICDPNEQEQIDEEESRKKENVENSQEIKNSQNEKNIQQDANIDHKKNDGQIAIRAQRIQLKEEQSQKEKNNAYSSDEEEEEKNKKKPSEISSDDESVNEPKINRKNKKQINTFWD